MNGHVTIDMESIYHKNDTPISASIVVTGRNPGLSIYLYNASSEIENITLKQTDASNRVELEKYLVGNAFHSGKYDVFINTTKLSEGYYRLVYSLSINGRPIDGHKYGKSFYLMNASEK